LQLFSTSFIDLMACALAGACILWVLTLEASSAPERARNQRALWIRISQVGVSHFDEGKIAIEPSSGPSLSFEQLSALQRVETENGSEMTFEFEEPATPSAASFGGWLSLKVENLSEDLTLRLGFGTCKEEAQVHDIQLTVFDAAGSRSEVYLYTRACALSKTLGLLRFSDTCEGVEDGDAVGERRRSFRDRLAILAGGGGLELLQVLDTRADDRAWRIEIRADATVEVFPPPLWIEGNEASIEALGGTS
jgi:hypothetical protein